MLTIRKASDRGRTKIDWLDSRHTFSFGHYQDPDHMGYRSLRVINDDLVAPGAGFPTHPHRDMEIVTFVLTGALEHKDSTGGGSVIRPGDVQRMTAGTGIRHSEFNPSPDEPVHLLQIWILPAEQGRTPGYEQRHFGAEERRGALRLIASPDGERESVTIGQDARVYASILEPGEEVTHRITSGRGVWLHVARGAVEVGGHALNGGDGAAIENEPSVTIRASEPAEILLFDLA